MASIRTREVGDIYSAKALCLIVGLACLAGFGLGLLAVALPPNPLDAGWRLTMLQQVGDRSIILLFGAALTMYGILEYRPLLRQLSLGCLVIGVIFHLSCILLIQDSVALRNQTLENIGNQVEQVHTQAESAKANPNASSGITPAQIDQALREIANQAENLKQNAQADIAKNAIVAIGNIVIVGLSLIGLGRFGIRKT